MKSISTTTAIIFLLSMLSCNQEKMTNETMQEFDVLAGEPLTFQDSAKKYYAYIQAYNTSMALTVDSIPPKFDAQITLQQYSASRGDQQFRIVTDGNGNFSFINRATTMALTRYGNENGGIMVQESVNSPTTDQLFVLVPIPNMANREYFSIGFPFREPFVEKLDTAYFQTTANNSAGGFITITKKKPSPSLLFKIVFSTEEIERQKLHVYNPILPHINYAIKVRKSGLFICATGGQGSTGANKVITQEESNIKNAFAWQFIPSAENPGFFNIINYSNGLSLDVQNASTVQGANLVQNPPNNTASQLFSLDSAGIGMGYWRIINKNSGLCVTIADTSSAAGTIVELATYTGTTSQQFLIEAIPYNLAPLPKDQIVFMSSASQKIMQSNLTGAFLIGSTGTNLQRFTASPISSGSDTVGLNIVEGSPSALCTNGLTAPGSQLIMQDYNSFTKDYQWKIQATGNGMYKIVSMETNLCVTESANGYTQEKYTGAANQQFAVIPVRPMNFLVSNINCWNALHNTTGDDVFYHTWGDTEPGVRVPATNYHTPGMYSGYNWAPDSNDNNRNFFNNMNFELWQYSTLGNNQAFPTISVGNGSSTYFMPGTWNQTICLDNNDCNNCQYVITFSVLGK